MLSRPTETRNPDASTEVAWVSEAELEPGTTYKRSVRRNTGEWLMGCRGEGGGGGRRGGDTD